jgi:prepilin peptidase CpaA
LDIGGRHRPRDVKEIEVMEIVSLPLGVAVVAAVVAAVTDVRSFTVHNVLTLPLLVTGLIYHGFANGGAAFSSSLHGALFGFGVLMVFYLMGGIGAGDVKLMAGIGAWLGMSQTMVVFTVAALAGGVYGLVQIAVCGRWRESWVNVQILWHRVAAVGRHLGAEDRVEAEVRRDDRRRRLVPFAAMIMVGVVMSTALSWYHVSY